MLVNTESGGLEAELEPESVWSAPVRTASVEPLGWTPQPLRLGGEVALEQGLGLVSFQLEVQGLRRFDRRGALLDEQRLGEPPKATYEARAVVLRFPPETGATAGAVHALVHLIWSVLPRLLCAGDLDLDVVLLEPDDRGAPGLAMVDLHPFGAGFADVLGARSLRKILALAKSMASETARAASGPICRCPTEGVEPPDAEAASILLVKLLGG
jgi:hypothetical protein